MKFILMGMLGLLLSGGVAAQPVDEWTTPMHNTAIGMGWIPYGDTYRFYRIFNSSLYIMTGPYCETAQTTIPLHPDEFADYGPVVYSLYYDCTGDGIQECIITRNHNGRNGLRIIDPVTGSTYALFDDVQYSQSYTMIADLDGDSRLEIVIRQDTWPNDGSFRYQVLETDGILVAEESTSRGDLAAFGMEWNYPNPFNPGTVIEYTLSRPSGVSIDIYDITGRVVTVLTEAGQNAETCRVHWDGTDSGGHPVASGTYFYQLRVDGIPRETRKMQLVR